MGEEYPVYTTRWKENPKNDEEYEKIRALDGKKYNMKENVERYDRNRNRYCCGYELSFIVGFHRIDRLKYKRFRKKLNARKSKEAKNEAYRIFLSDVQDNIHEIQKQINNDMQKSIDKMTKQTGMWKGG